MVQYKAKCECCGVETDLMYRSYHESKNQDHYVCAKCLAIDLSDTCKRYLKNTTKLQDVNDVKLSDVIPPDAAIGLNTEFTQLSIQHPYAITKKQDSDTAASTIDQSKWIIVLRSNYNGCFRVYPISAQTFHELHQELLDIFPVIFEQNHYPDLPI